MDNIQHSARLCEPLLAHLLVFPHTTCCTLCRPAPSPCLQACQLRQEFNIDIRVLGIADSTNMMTSEGGIDLDNWRQEWAAKKQPNDLQVCMALALAWHACAFRADCHKATCLLKLWDVFTRVWEEGR